MSSTHDQPGSISAACPFGTVGFQYRSSSAPSGHVRRFIGLTFLFQRNARHQNWDCLVVEPTHRKICNRKIGSFPQGSVSRQKHTKTTNHSFRGSLKVHLDSSLKTHLFKVTFNGSNQTNQFWGTKTTHHLLRFWEVLWEQIKIAS